MDTFKKILINIFCLITLLSSIQLAAADETSKEILRNLLTIEQQMDALYFHASYLKMNSKIFKEFDISSFGKKNIENMSQWRQSLFEYIKNLIPPQRPIFFCYVYQNINPQSNIMLCAPPTAITNFKMDLIYNLTTDYTRSDIIRVYLTYNHIHLAKLLM